MYVGGWLDARSTLERDDISLTQFILKTNLGEVIHIERYVPKSPVYDPLIQTSPLFLEPERGLRCTLFSTRSRLAP